ncbi:hypothetical protein [Sphingomonas sp. LT1P40]|uniref:hypothetical protein n=1 Tax=Alteristakelama amylovorans TaxID=3096166 RepID=UPI002FCB12E8
MILAALLLQATATAPSPDAQLLARFVEGCDRVGQYNASANMATVTGWGMAGFPPEYRMSDARVRRIVAALKQEAGTDSKLSIAPFMRTDGPRTIYMLLTTQSYGGNSAKPNRCILLDLDARTPLDPALLARAIGSKPDKVEGRGATARRYWAHSWKPGIWAEARFIAPRSREARTLGYSGRILTAFSRSGG